MKTTNVDKIVTSLKSIPCARTKVVSEMKREAHRAFRRKANRLAKAGDDETTLGPAMTSWDVW